MAAKLTPEVIRRALDLQRRLWTQERIAAELGVCRESISRALAKINRRAAEKLAKRRAECRARQVDQLEWIAGEAAAAWERSLADAEMIRTTTETETDEGKTDSSSLPTPHSPLPTHQKTVKTVKGQSGNPALLREAREALADIREILGTEPDGQDEAQNDYSIDLAPEDPPALQTDGATT